MIIKDLKKGDFFTLKDISEPKENQVFIRGEYNRNMGAYECIRFSDVNDFRCFKGEKEIFTNFIF